MRLTMPHSAAFAFAIALPCLAPQTPGPQDPPVKVQDKQTTTFSIKPLSSIKDLLDRASRFLKCTILYDEATIQRPGSNINGLNAGRLQVDAFGCLEVVSQVLFANGFLLISVDDLRKTYRVIDARGSERFQAQAFAPMWTPDKVMRRSRVHMLVSTTMDLKHADASRVANVVRVMHSNNGPAPLIMSAATRKTVVLKGLAPEVASVLQILAKIDQPPRLIEPGPLESRLKKLEARLKRLEGRPAK